MDEHEVWRFGWYLYGFVEGVERTIQCQKEQEEENAVCYYYCCAELFVVI